LNIEHGEGTTKGRYFHPAEGGPTAELTYSVAGESPIIIDRTEVPEAYRGQGMGVALVARAVEDMRAAGRKIMPLCPFAVSQFRKHPEWRDLLPC
jgi:hypothetical protein